MSPATITSPDHTDALESADELFDLLVSDRQLAESVPPAPYRDRIRSRQEEEVRMPKTHHVVPRRLLTLLTVLVTGFLLLATRANAEVPVVYPEYTVVSGDTLWEIASGITPEGGDIRRVVYEIQDLNGFETSDIRAGQIILLPGS